MPATPEVSARLAQLAEEYDLPPQAPERLEALLALLEAEPTSITAVKDPAEGVDLHVADSLVALELPEVRGARRIADLGSGGGFPGLVLAIALPDAHVALVESLGRKVAFLQGAIERLELPNAAPIRARAEEWRQGMGAHDLVTARALAPLTVLIEYAAPLLVVGGSLVAWKGARDATEEADGRASAATVGMSDPSAHPVQPFATVQDRNLYLSSKLSPTPSSYPRRAGMARKGPIRAST